MVVLLLLVDGFRIARPPWVPNPDSCYSITILISSIFTSYPFTLYRSICVYIHTHGYKSLPVLVIPAIAIDTYSIRCYQESHIQSFLPAKVQNCADEQKRNNCWFAIADISNKILLVL